MTAMPALYADRIIQDPDILHGKPVIKGTRIPVQVVLEYLAHNPNFDDLIADYPRLTMADVQACREFPHPQLLAHCDGRGEHERLVSPLSPQRERGWG